MNDRMKTLIATVAENNGIAISRKDPIMVLFTALEFLLSQQEESQAKAVRELRAQMEDVTTNWQK